ncbi:MAG: hypothetical protein LBP98_00650, partial [Tannerella sp.]|nr:hypothetical protein [Tannerella sp.]
PPPPPRHSQPASGREEATPERTGCAVGLAYAADVWANAAPAQVWTRALNPAEALVGMTV